MRLHKYLLMMLLVCVGTGLQAQIFKTKKNKNADELYAEAVEATRAKQYREAIALGQQALKVRPGYTDAELLLGRLYMLTGNYTAARFYVEGVIKKSPGYRDAYLYIVNIDLLSGRYSSAEKYVEQALSQFKDDKDFLVKKLQVLDLTQRYQGGNVLADNLVERFPGDTTVRKSYIGHYLQAGHFYRQRGIPALAETHYQKALAMQPGNDEASSSITNMYLRNGSYQRALEQVNAALANNPSSYELLMRKLGLQQDMHDYPEALYTLQQILRYHPGDAKARSLDVSLRMEAAAWFANSDPYLLYSGILEKSPGNREALDKVIGMSLSRGAYREALAWINSGLKNSPNDQRLLALKLDVLENDRKFGEAANLAERLLRAAPTAEKRQRYTALRIASGRDYLAQEQYDLALSEFESALRETPGDTAALDMTANVFITRKDYRRALDVLNTALKVHPDNVRFLMKKSTVLAGLGQYDDAADIARSLRTRFPDNENYKAFITDMHLTAGRRFMQEDEFTLAKGQFSLVLGNDPENLDALNYLVNLESARKQYDSALYYADVALRVAPDNRDMLLKKASVYTDMQRYADANAINARLMQRYPYTTKYRTAYVEGLVSEGLAYWRRNSPDSALPVFRQALAVDRKDSLALLNVMNIYYGRKSYDSALAYANEALRYYPDAQPFLQRRALNLEGLQDYKAAALAADTLARRYPTADNTDYADFMASKGLRNQFGLYYLNSNYDYASSNYNIATIEYRRFFKKGSWAARVNYAGREEGTGLMGEAELYYTHNKSLYSYALAAFGNKIVFPQVRLAYSIFKSFGETEGELGARYLLTDSANVITGVTSVARPFGDFWVNFRAYLISDEGDFNTSFNLTGRYYMNRRQDYLSVIAGLGTSPDDRSRLIQFPQLSGLLTRSVAAGYQKTLRYRTTLGIFGTWYNQKIEDNRFQNQYDIYITVQRKF
ncbi:tetratricopeptide repeat protein [Chitinophaga lutea]